MPRLVIVSNRLPLSLTREGGEVRLEQSAGGLATGLAGPHERLGGLWVGWPGSTEALSKDERARITRQLSDHRAVPVWLDPDDVKRFYEGCSKVCSAPTWSDSTPPRTCATSPRRCCASSASRSTWTARSSESAPSA